MERATSVAETQYPSVKIPDRWPLVTPMGNRDETSLKDARLVNCFAELDPTDGGYWIEKRLGLAAQATLGGAGAGVFNWLGDVYSIFDATLYKNGNYFATVDNSNGLYRFQPMRGVPPTLVFGNGATTYYTDGTVVTRLTAFAALPVTSLIVGAKYSIVSVGTSNFSTFGYASGTTINATALVAATQYQIVSVGPGRDLPHDGYIAPADFTLVGAADNNPGTIFTATGPTTGVGKVSLPLTNTIGQIFTASSVGTGTGTVAIVAGSFVVGSVYQIQSIGTTDFTLVGAASNTVGAQFTATGVGTGTGAAYSNVGLPTLNSLVKGFAYLDGTLYVMDPTGAIYGTKNLDDPTTWDSLNKIIARIEPDSAVFLTKNLSYVIAFKQWTTEAFYDAGNVVGSSLAPVQGLKIDIGCISGETVQEIDGTLIWVTFNRTVSPQVALMNNLQVQIVSTPQVERILDQADFTGASSWIIKHGGHRFYLLNLPANNRTLAYDIDQKLWMPWTDASGNWWPIVAATFQTGQKHIVQHATNGKLYYTEGDYEYPTDDGVVFPVDIYTPNFDAGVDRRKHLNTMEFGADQTPGSTLQVRCSDDDYRTWSNFRLVKLSNKRPMLTNCGTFKRRAYHFRHACPTPLRIKYVALQMDVGTL